MNSTGKIILIVAGVLFLGLVIYAWLQPKEHFYWGEDLGAYTEEPYGLSIFFELLDDAAPDGMKVVNRPIYQVLDEESSGTYVGMGHSMYWDKRDFDTLLHFVERGNQAFLSLSSIPLRVDSLFFDGSLRKKPVFTVHNGEVEEYWEQDTDAIELLDSLSFMGQEAAGFDYVDSVISLRLIEKGNTLPVELRYVVADSTDNFKWDYIPLDSLADNLEVNTLGVFNDEYANFIRIKYGKGEILFHHTPMVFTNYYLRRKDVFDYANSVLDYFEKDHIYWDNYNLFRHFKYQPYGTTFSKGPLSFILSQPALKWSWSILLILTILFLVFNLKRVQRIIPLAEKNENTSLEYVKTIGELYYRQRDHKSMAEKEMELFLYNVRKVYHLQTLSLDETFIKLLADRSGVDKNTISEIIKKGKAIDYLDGVSDEMYLTFQKALSKYYAMEKARSKRKKK